MPKPTDAPITVPIVVITAPSDGKKV